MKRYLNEECKNCDHNDENLLICVNNCAIPLDILREIEKNRKKRDEYIEIPGQIKIEV